MVDGSRDYAQALKTEFDVTRTETAAKFLDDGRRLYGRTLPGFPFSILISPDNKVVHKQVGSAGDAIRERLLTVPMPEISAAEGHGNRPEGSAVV